MVTFRTYLVRVFLFDVVFCCFKINAQSKNTLSYFLETAKTNSPVLNDFNNQVLSNRIDSLKLRATYGFIVTEREQRDIHPILKVGDTTAH
jgi:hypothetical protein